MGVGGGGGNGRCHASPASHAHQEKRDPEDRSLQHRAQSSSHEGVDADRDEHDADEWPAEDNPSGAGQQLR